MMSDLQLTILGAGQDVGRSCVVVTFPSRRVVLDCGAHCGFVDHRRYPALQFLGDVDEFDNHVDLLTSLRQTDVKLDDEDNGEIDVMDPFSANSFERISKKDLKNDDGWYKASCIKKAMKQTLNNITTTIDCTIISHFHLDHIGALPFLTEHIGYKGPIYMTYPTKGLSPVLLRDSAQVVASRWKSSRLKENTRNVDVLLNRSKKRKAITFEELEKIDPWGYTVECVADCLSKATPMQLKSSESLSQMNITPYYAGHVLGAAIFCVECDNFSVVYTGDFNTIPDKHLGPAKVPPLNPDVLICESTYATVVRQPRRATEMELCTAVHDCLIAGGKVLIPVFAVGRAQELAIILDNYWTKLQLTYPIYFGGGLSERATNYYRLHSAWTHSNNTPSLNENPFALNHMIPFENCFLNDERPMVLFATPGMVHAGLSLRACKLWAPNPKNLIVIPGYSVQGTVGNKIISGEKKIQTSSGTFEVKCKVRYLSFSAHADSAGIMRMIRHIRPKNVVLVHGEYEGMKRFSKHLTAELGIPIYCPANGQTIKFAKEAAETMSDVYFYPEIFLESAGLENREQCKGDHGDGHSGDLLGLCVKNEANISRRLKAIAFQNNQSASSCGNLQPQQDIFLVTRQHLLEAARGNFSSSILGGRTNLHIVTHRKTLEMTTNKFIEVTEFIAKLKALPQAFCDRLPIVAEELENGVKHVKLGSLEAKHDPESGTLSLQWNEYDCGSVNSSVNAMLYLFLNVSTEN